MENEVRFTEEQTLCRRTPEVCCSLPVSPPLPRSPFLKEVGEKPKKPRIIIRKRKIQQWREAGGVKPRRREEPGTARYEAENKDSLTLFFYVTIPSYFLFGAGSTQEEEPGRGRVCLFLVLH